jgi:hypothetical protein
VKVLRRREVESPVIVLDEFFRLDEWLPKNAAAHRRFALDSDAARFFGWTIEQAEAAPDSQYDEVIARFAREWHEANPLRARDPASLGRRSRRLRRA